MDPRRGRNRVSSLLIGALLLPTLASYGQAQATSAGVLLDRLSTRLESLGRQLETLRERVREGRDWGAPCCSATTQVMRSTLGQIRSTLATLRAGYREARHDRGLALAGELSAQTRGIEAALAALDQARSPSGARAAVGRVSEGIAALRRKLAELRACCYYVR